MPFGPRADRLQAEQALEVVGELRRARVAARGSGSRQLGNDRLEVAR